MPNKPTFKPGEYGPAVPVKYTDAKYPELSGTYSVELGAEVRDENNRWDLRRRLRLCRVNGYEVKAYAMVRHKKPGERDTKIERNENVLRQRAVEWYVVRTLHEQVENRIREEQANARIAALYSPDAWRFEEGINKSGRGDITIEPLGLGFQLWDGEPEECVEQKRLILRRLIELAKEHGLGEGK